MNRPDLRRIDPRRPARVTPQGLRRIVLGGTEGERTLRLPAHGHAATRRPRLAQPATGCLLVLTQADNGGLDEHARETIAAAALLARADEAVVVAIPSTAPSLQLDASAYGLATSGRSVGNRMTSLIEPSIGTSWLGSETSPNVANTAVSDAMNSEFLTAPCSAELSASAANHFVVNPVNGKAMMVASLNANIGKSTIGA